MTQGSSTNVVDETLQSYPSSEAKKLSIKIAVIKPLFYLKLQFVRFKISIYAAKDITAVQ